MLTLSTLLISMFITLMLVPILRTAASKLGWGMDYPAPRKVHGVPKARVGGAAMALGVLVPMVLWIDGSRFVNAVIIGAWIVAFFGLADDIKKLGWKAKFLGQVLAALVVIFYGQNLICHLGVCIPGEHTLSHFVSIPLTLLVIVGVTNAINLADGLDGLAGGILLIIFICIGYLAFTLRSVGDNTFIMLISLAAIGSLVGFLRFNTYPSTVFMGDTGSQLMGFLAITLSIGLTQSSSVVSPMLPLLMLGFPILDTLVVMAERIAQGRSPFLADKNHFHHKLMRMGLYHTEAVAVIYTITTGLVLTAFMLRFHSEWLLLGLYGGFCVVVVTGFTYMDKHGWQLNRGETFFDVNIKQRLRPLKDIAVLIKFLFLLLQALLLLVLLAASLVPAVLPPLLSWIAGGCAALLMGVLILKKAWIGIVVRSIFYFMIPLVLYFGIADPAEWAGQPQLRVINICFALVALLSVMTLKFTRREKGFQATPLDFLILMIALVVPNLPDTGLRSFHMGGLAVKIIILLYGFEIIIGEYRGKYEKLALAMLALLLLVLVRGFLNF